MRRKEYSIEMTPIPWARPYHNKHHYYDGQVDKKVIFGLHAQRAHNDEPLFIGPISIEMIFFFERSKRSPEHHMHYPDLDNLVKFCLDALKGVVITDDRYICSLTAKKEYAQKGKIFFVISEMFDEQKKE